MKQLLKSPFAQQCLGAAVGAFLAYMLYATGTWAMGKVEAMLTSPVTKEQVAEMTREDKLEAIGEVAKKASSEK